MNHHKQSHEQKPAAEVEHDGRVTRRRADVSTLIPASVLNPKLARSARRRRRVALTGVSALVIAGGGFAVAHATGPSTAKLRTAAVATRSVDSVLNGVATIEAVSQAKVAFPVSGTVADVAVAVGDTVQTGQSLAALDTASLLEALHEKQSALAGAQLILTKALAGDDVSSLVGGGGGGAGAAGFSVGADEATFTDLVATAATPTFSLLGAVTVSEAVDPDVAAAQQAVLSAQQAVDAALAAASTALSAATSVCGAIGIDANSDPATVLGSLNACQSALSDVQTAQNRVSSAQDDLATASTALDDLLQSIADATTTTTAPATTVPDTTTPDTTTPATTTPDTTTPDTTATTVPATTVPTGGGTPMPSSTPSSTPSTGTGGQGGGGQGGAPTDSTTADGSAQPTDSTGGTGDAAGGGGSVGGGGTFSGGGSGGGSSASASPSAADLIAYQSSVDSAMTAVAVAQQAIDQATVTSPVSGTVIAVGIAAGDSATADSTTQNIVIQSAAGFEATTTVALADVPDVKVGQVASVLADGSSTPLSGKVVSISAVPAADTTTTSYGVVIALDDATEDLNNGAIGSVAITTGSDAGAIAVPTSAITVDGDVHTVEVEENGSTTTTPVQVGVVGETWTQITSGLTVGQIVVLADLGKALPTSATDSSNATTANRTGGFGTGGRGTGGFTPPSGAGGGQGGPP